jgi:hypothetical protein
MKFERRDRLIGVPRLDVPATVMLMQPPVESLKNKNRVRASLRAFSTYMNTTDELSKLMEIHRKQKDTRPQVRFVVSEPLSGVHYTSSDPLDGWRYIDGDHGISIGIIRDGFRTPVWLATAGFSPQDEKSIIINMLQGYKIPDPERQALQKEMFEHFNIERALVNLLALWGIRTGIRDIYVEPAENKAYFYRSDEERERAILRYNVTPGRLGFRKDPATDLYKLSLAAETEQ